MTKKEFNRLLVITNGSYKIPPRDNELCYLLSKCEIKNLPIILHNMIMRLNDLSKKV